jgi:hypothetical protein
MHDAYDRQGRLAAAFGRAGAERYRVRWTGCGLAWITPRRPGPPALFEGTGESSIYSIYRYECCRSQRMAIAPQIGGR